MMSESRMHPGEVGTDATLVHRLLARQFPSWAGLRIVPVPSWGTDNALYRLGEDMVIRLPRIEWAAGGVASDFRWLPDLALRLPVAVPVPLALGKPGEGFPWSWGVYRWLEGESPAGEAPEYLAADLASFLTALHGVEMPGGPPAPRGVPLSDRDAQTRVAIGALAGEFEERAMLAAWEHALRSPGWAAAPVWIHGDLLAGNLLLHEDRLAAVIDFGGVGIGDPASDLIIAWSLFTGAARGVLREAIAVDPATWARGRGWALSWAVIARAYYRKTNRALAVVAGRTIREVLAES